MDKYTSRKFLTAVTAISTILGAIFSGAVDAPTGIAGILSIATTYIVTEGIIDARRAAAIAHAAAGVTAVASKALDEAAKSLDTAAAATPSPTALPTPPVP